MKILLPLLTMPLFVINSPAQDHTENLSGPFENVQQVTEECLMCHEDAGDELLQSKHWNWLTSNLTESVKDGESFDKRFPINNFCIAVKDDSVACITCHLPNEKKKASLNFNTAENIDCLVCHEQTGAYVKAPLQYSADTSKIDLLKIAQSVAKPKSKNCGTCHFSQMGGVLLKNGGMDKSLFNPSEEVDFHMAGLGFGCSDCHETSKHQIAGGKNTGEDKVACENCHEATPHEKELLNKHYSAVACETCHIPSYAREEAVVTDWDWSKAGEETESSMPNTDEKLFDKAFGRIILSKNVKPEYYWNNGKMNYYNLGEKIENTKSLELNKPTGQISDRNSKISPFEVLKSTQPYDPVNKYLIIPKFYGEDGYWNTFNWVSASEEGMKEVNLKFSGSVDFIETKMYRPINHLVVSSDNALECTTCHGKGGEHLLNWKALGYPDDPIKKGGRVKNKLIKE